MPDLSLADWQRLCPDLTIENNANPDAIEFTAEELTAISTSFWERGYLQLDPVFSKTELEILAIAMGQLSRENIPPVFIYVFDQPWFLFEKLRGLLGHLLGDDYALLPNLWAWHLNKLGDAGWPPHRDCDSQTVFSVGEDQMLMSLSLWLPLTDVTVQNGCMSVIPRCNETALPENGSLDAGKLEPLSVALPAKAGSVLGWPQDLVHWGGIYTDPAAEPRISLSFEFQNSSFDPLIEPLLDTGCIPPFDQRLSLIKQQFDKYRHIAPDLA